MSKGTGKFFLGTIFGAAIGTVVGLLIAPRSGEETRAMIADKAYDLRDKALDAYGQGVSYIQDRIDEYKPYVEQTTEELKSKLNLARERMDKVRTNLSDQMTTAADGVHSAVEQLKKATAASSAKQNNAKPGRKPAAKRTQANKPAAKKPAAKKR